MYIRMRYFEFNYKGTKYIIEAHSLHRALVAIEKEFNVLKSNLKEIENGNSMMNVGYSHYNVSKV